MSIPGADDLATIPHVRRGGGQICLPDRGLPHAYDAAMRRALLTLSLVVASTSLAHAEKSRQTAQLLSGVGASVSGGVVIGGFMFARDGKRINEPVMYTGIGMLFVTPSLGEFYAGQYVT